MQIFKNHEFGTIRTFTNEQGEALFCAKDVCDALGYKQTHKAVERHVDEGDGMKRPTPTKSGTQTMLYVNESGLYALILSSKLDSARRFKRWVTSEVLPAIRQNGRYELELHNRQLEQRNALLEEINTQQKPLTDYARTILSSTQTVTITQIAQDYGFTAVRFNELLRNLRIQHKVGGQWILYTPYINKGYVQSFSSYFVKEDGEVQVKLHTRWTQGGRLFLYEELKKAGILPSIELN